MSSANVKEKSPPTQNECAERIETTTSSSTATATATNYMNNVQIIPSNYSSTEQNSIVTVQVTNDSNTPGHINDQLSPPKAVAAASTNKNGMKSAATIASDDDVKNSRKFGAVTNISIGEQQQQQQQQQPQIPVESHYEQVFIMHTPSTASISAVCNSEQSNDHKPKINRIKVDSAHRTDNAEARPSTSTASSVTLSVVASSSSSAVAVASAAANTSNADPSGAPNSVSNKSKDAIKNRSVENNLENDTTLLCRRPLLSRGLTEAVIMRPSRKDVNMLLNRINPQGNHVSTTPTLDCFISFKFHHFFTHDAFNP